MHGGGFIQSRAGKRRKKPFAIASGNEKSLSKAKKSSDKALRAKSRKVAQVDPSGRKWTQVDPSAR